MRQVRKKNKGRIPNVKKGENKMFEIQPIYICAGARKNGNVTTTKEPHARNAKLAGEAGYTPPQM